jgi:hypothetical protein
MCAAAGESAADKNGSNKQSIQGDFTNVVATGSALGESVQCTDL